MLVLIELNLDEKIVDKIKELLEDGTYENEKELIIRAIENLYERTKAVGDSTITVAVDHPIIQKLSDIICFMYILIIKLIVVGSQLFVGLYNKN